MLRALVFDFDGLILDTESVWIDGYGDVHAEHGRPFDRELFLRCVGHVDISFDPWRAFDPRHDRRELERALSRHKRRRLEAQAILPGVVALMDEARARGLPIALASNSDHAHCEGHLARLGLLDRFTVLGCREDVTSPKPEPDLYRHVVNRLGLRPHEAVAFEDSHAGSLAAKRAGLWCVVVPNDATRHHACAHADWRVPSLAGVTLAALEARFFRST
jgi:HAD superfamily hydrolase (TIGR01509 family)